LIGFCLSIGCSRVWVGKPSSGDSAPSSEEARQAAPAESPKVGRTVQERLGDKAVSILSAPTKVGVFRIDPRWEARKLPGDHIHGYLVLSKGQDQDAGFGARLGAVLLREDTYNRPMSIKCHDPGVVFRVWKGDDSVDVLICFACVNLLVTPTEKNGFGDFSASVWPELVKLAKKAFPEDQEIQTIPETPSEHLMEFSRRKP
jgi:hypothetical protein